MSNLAIQRSCPRRPAGDATTRPGSRTTRCVRALPLFEGIRDEDLIAAMAQGGIARPPARARHVRARSDRPRAAASRRRSSTSRAARSPPRVFMENELAERRAAQLAHETATKEEREAESLIKPPPLARIALKNVALFMEGDLFNSGALSAARGQPIAFYTTAPSALVSLDHRWIAELAVRHPLFERGCAARSRSRASGSRGSRASSRSCSTSSSARASRLGRDGARAPARPVHRLQAVRGGLRGALRRAPADARRLPARHARLHLHVPHVHRSALHRSVRVRLDQVRRRSARRS